MHKYKDCIPALDTAFLWVFSALQWDLLEPFWSGDVPLRLLWGSIIQVTFCRSAFHPQILRSGLRSVNRNNAAASSAAGILKKKVFHWWDVLSSLRSSEAKYDSGTGWPAFKEAHGTWERDESLASVIRRPDNSLGSAGTEVLCKNVSPTLSYAASLFTILFNLSLC